MIRDGYYGGHTHVKEVKAIGRNGIVNSSSSFLQKNPNGRRKKWLV